MKKWKRQRAAGNVPAPAQPTASGSGNPTANKKWKKRWQGGQQGQPSGSGSLIVLAFVAKGPAQEAYPDMLAKVFGDPAKGAGHFSIPARGGAPFSTGYAFQGYENETEAMEAKLAASPIADHFERELIQISADERLAAEKSTSTGQLPVIAVNP